MSGKFDLRFEHSEPDSEKTPIGLTELIRSRVLEPRTDAIPPAAKTNKPN